MARRKTCVERVEGMWKRDPFYAASDDGEQFVARLLPKALRAEWRKENEHIYRTHVPGGNRDSLWHALDLRFARKADKLAKGGGK